MGSSLFFPMPSDLRQGRRFLGGLRLGAAQQEGMSAQKEQPQHRLLAR